MNRMLNEMKSTKNNLHKQSYQRLPNSNRHNVYLDQDNITQSRYQIHTKNWKNMLLPQIQLKYQEIMRQREISTKRIEIDNQKSMASVIPKNSKVTPHLTSSTIIETKNMQNIYEQKIHSLEEQNQNLKQQLFYLRQALLITFQTKQQNKVKTPTKKPQ